MLKPAVSLLLYVACAVASSVASSQAHAACPSSANSSDFPESLVTSADSVGIESAWYDGATDRYSHGVLGDAIEPSILSVSVNTPCDVSVTLNTDHVFEDIAPRLADVDGEPGAEVVTVRSHRKKGAQIAIYALVDNSLQLLATTPYIGTANRWLAPVGIADFDNDGYTDIAFVDRPHLAKVLRVWSYQNGELVEVASSAGYSNHKIGQDFISGGIRNCGATTEMITADNQWTKVLATSLIDGELISKVVGEFKNTDSLSEALQCP